MLCPGIDEMGGSGNCRGDGTSWDKWWAEVRQQLPGPLTFEVTYVHLPDGKTATKQADLEAEYRQLYEAGYTVHDAFCAMY